MFIILKIKQKDNLNLMNNKKDSMILNAFNLEIRGHGLNFNKKK